MRGYQAAMIAASMLGGCGFAADDPANIPQRGRWQREFKLVTLVANDIWLERKDAPFKLPEDRTESLGCTEPRLRSVKELNALMPRRDGPACTFESMDRKDGRFSAAGKCAPTEHAGLEIFGAVGLEGREKPDHIKSTAGMSLIVRGREGSSERVRLAYETVWTRLGDC